MTTAKKYLPSLGRIGERFMGIAMLATLLAAGAGADGGVIASSMRVVRTNVQVVSPGDVGSIVASDTATNNSANASLSIPLQDSHETCLQATLDDATFRGELASGSTTLGGSFSQVPTRSFVPHESSYPAFFSVLAADKSSGQPTTNSLLTYVKLSPSSKWKLALSSQILGPTDAGVAVPAASKDAQGYVGTLSPTAVDGLIAAPNAIAAQIAKAFTSQAATGKMPSGFSAQFGPKALASPRSIATAYASVGGATVTFTATAPGSAAGGSPSKSCPYPVYRLSNGGALVTFAIFARVGVKIPAGEAVVQPSNRSAFGGLLAPGVYSSLTIQIGDMGVAVVPPAGSHAAIDVIGQESEELSEVGVSTSGSTTPSGAGGPSNPEAIANRVDPGVVDINTVLDYGAARAAGTGMVLTKSGEVLTNNHVIEGATTISVTDVGNHKTYGAKVLGYDRSNDVAVLQLENASNLATVTLAESSSVHSGEGVVAIGNAGGTGGTPNAASGRVTALNQAITASDAADGSSEQLTGLIQTNADIQPGDSGGPLVDVNGRVIGMDTAASESFSFIQGPTLGTQGFAIPSSTASAIAREITAQKASSTVHIGATAYLGVGVRSASSAGFGGFGQPVSPPTTSGALIESVASGSPAARAGLIAGDVITSLAGTTVTTASSLTTILTSKKPGTSVRLAYLDPSNRAHTITIVLGSGPPQ